MVDNANTSSNGIKENISDTKVCPYCGEDIKIEAVKCKHCQSRIVITKHQKVKNHITKIITLIFYIYFVRLELGSIFQPSNTRIIEVFLNYLGTTGLLIGILALIKGNVLGWGIHNRKVALIVIIVSFIFMVFVANFFKVSLDVPGFLEYLDQR